MKKIINILMRYLKSSGLKEWNQVAVDWNCDNGLKPLRWIIEQPECDKGTALLIYWVSDPNYFL